jgi:hypothetical protein
VSGDDVMLTSRDVSRLMKKGDAWFAGARVRRELYARGFPRPRIRGRWSRAEVLAWINGAPPPPAAPAPPPPAALAPDGNHWSRIISARGDALDKGIDPDAIRAAK